MRKMNGALPLSFFLSIPAMADQNVLLKAFLERNFMGRHYERLVKEELRVDQLESLEDRHGEELGLKDWEMRALRESSQSERELEAFLTERGLSDAYEILRNNCVIVKDLYDGLLSQDDYVQHGLSLALAEKLAALAKKR